MALNIEGKKCPVCDSYLFPEDDIAFCPTCGAPHHRDCYKAVGHCALEHLHGTEKQYGKAEAATSEAQQPLDESTPKSEKICPNCKNKLTDDMLVCPYCGRPRNARVFTFDMLGGVKAETDLGGGVTAAEASKFVQVNTHRYIPKFAELKNRKASWNWAAFLFPEGWFFSRKMYGKGALFTALMAAAQICYIPLTTVANTVILGTTSEYMQYIMQNAASFGKGPLIVAAIGTLTVLITRFIAGIFGDSFYKSHVLQKVTELRGADDPEEKNRKLGGVNLIAFLIGVVIITYIPNIITMFF